MRRLRIGVVGLGYGQRVLIPAFRSTGRCDVTAVCAESRQRAQEIAGRLEVPKAYGEWQGLVGDPQVDAVVIATPPILQPAIATAAAAARKPVFCEKPLATSRTAAADLADAVRRADVANMIDFEFPMLHAWQRAKALLARGTLGRLRHAVVLWQVETSANRAALETWKTRAEHGGGVLNLFASHVVYNLEWLLGPIARLSARLWHEDAGCGSGPNETGAIVCASLHGGTPVSITVSNNARLGGGHRLELYGAQGTLVLDNPSASTVRGFRLWLGRRQDDRLVEVRVAGEPRVRGDDRIGPVARLARRFVAWIERGIPASPTVEEGLRVQCVLDAVREADQAGRWVDVEDMAVVGMRQAR